MHRDGPVEIEHVQVTHVILRHRIVHETAEGRQVAVDQRAGHEFREIDGERRSPLAQLGLERVFSRVPW